MVYDSTEIIKTPYRNIYNIQGTFLEMHLTQCID